jgi:hypothetical protein
MADDAGVWLTRDRPDPTLGDMTERSESASIAEVGQRMLTRYPDLSAADVSAAINAAAARFDRSPIRDFIPLLVDARSRPNWTTA